MNTNNEPPNLFYRGSSMKGTFKPGDRLSIEKIPFGEIRKGDLIIFRKIIDEKSELVVHRVTRTTPRNLVMRGDNCRGNDDQPVPEADIIGRVIRYDRKGKFFSAGNGLRGRIHARRLHTRLRIFRIAKRILRKPYRLLKKSGMIARIWRPELQAVRFQTPDGPLIKFVHKNRTAAGYQFEKKAWTFRRPYDLIIGPATRRR